MKYKLARRSCRLILVIVGVCLTMPATASCHAGFTLSEGRISGEAVNRLPGVAVLMVFSARTPHLPDPLNQSKSCALASPIFLPTDLIDRRNDRGVAGHGYDLGSALEYHVPSGWIRPGEYRHPIDIPLITSVLPCCVFTHDPNDPAQGPIFGGAAVNWHKEFSLIDVMWVEVRRITSAILWT